MADALYSVDKPCPVCEQTFSIVKVRTRLTTVKRDSDFCTYYHGVNPYYYTVIVCPFCGYAVAESDFESQPNEKVVKFLATKRVKADFTGTRTREQAISTYKLIIYYSNIVGVTASKLAGYYLRLAWLYREGENKEDEIGALTKAVEYYEKAMNKERFPIGNMSEVSLMYLMGDLLRRIDRLDEALLYFNRVVSTPAAKMEPKVLDMAREAWKETRELQKQEEPQEA